jgi:hypothetical protein
MDTYSKGFWDSVAKFYGEHQLTNHQSDYELEFVINTVGAIGFIYNLVCLGVADGSRDPYIILKYLSEMKVGLPTETHINDLSDKLLDECKKKLVEFPMEISYHAKPMKEVEIGRKFTNPNIILGLYNYDYLLQSLQGYLESKDVIGDMFEVRYTTFTDGKINHSDERVRFNIEEYVSYSEQFVAMSQKENFLAFSIKTDKQFISHYWHAPTLIKLLQNIFTGLNVKVYDSGKRYVIGYITNPCTDEGETTLLTSLNNVIGNIPTECQYDSLVSIRNMFV